MAESEPTGPRVGLHLTDDPSQMIFRCDLGKIQMGELLIDEKNSAEADRIGPNPSRLLALGIMGCLSASLIFCLKKRNFSIADLHAEAQVTLHRNSKGFWRVQKIDVDLRPKISDPEAIKRFEQCMKKTADGVPFFEQFCIVTESVRTGIAINVNVAVDSGN
jgi:organic hydroperoxide reductase OsmC/OhrA